MPTPLQVIAAPLAIAIATPPAIAGFQERGDRGDRGTPGNRRPLLDEQCDACGRWGHNANTCNPLGIFVLCSDYASKNSDQAKQLALTWKQKNNRSAVKLVARALTHDQSAAEDLLLSPAILDELDDVSDFP